VGCHDRRSEEDDQHCRVVGKVGRMAADKGSRAPHVSVSFLERPYVNGPSPTTGLSWAKFA
jgi:hypothetical protein